MYYKKERIRILIDGLFYILLFKIAREDAKSRKIQNKDVIFLMMLAVIQLVVGNENGAAYFVGMLVISIPMLIVDIIRPGMFGGGDIKLLAAGGLFLGEEKIVMAFIIAVFLAAVYCIWLLQVKKKDRTAQFPLGPFLCIGMGVTNIF